MPEGSGRAAQRQPGEQGSWITTIASAAPYELCRSRWGDCPGRTGVRRAGLAAGVAAAMARILFILGITLLIVGAIMVVFDIGVR